MTPHHEHEFEAAPGLPEPLPPGERIVWQGAPDWRVLALHAYHLRQLAGYFGVMMAIQALYHWDAPAGTLLSSLALSAALAAVLLVPDGPARQSARRRRRRRPPNRRPTARPGAKAGRE